MDIKEYWQAVLRQDAPAIREYFWEDAYICWHNTDERFTVEEFIRANCEYPGQWDGEVKRLVQDGDQIAVAVRVCYRMKRDTRHFAKRQLTWFRRERSVIWVEKQEFGYDNEKILSYLKEILTEKHIL